MIYKGFYLLKKELFYTCGLFVAQSLLSLIICSDVEEDGGDEVEGRGEDLYRQFLHERMEREPTYHNSHHLEQQVPNPSSPLS